MKKGIILLSALFSCVGTDYLDDPIVGEKIIVADETVALMPNGQVQAVAEYFDRYGIQQDVMLEWQSSNPLIAVVDNTGVITAIAEGQALIQPSYESFLGHQIQVTVVSDPTAVATVEITALTTNLIVGEKTQLLVSVKNFDGNELFIVKSAVEKVQGTIQVQSEFGMGTTFVIKIPNLQPTDTN